MRLQPATTLLLWFTLSTTSVAQQIAKSSDFQFDGSINFQYKQAGKDRINLHVFFPEGWTRHDTRAAIVFFFGGGWVGGTPQQFVPQCEHLAQRGMVAITAEYRVRNRHGVHPAECVADAKDAVRWVRSHARELGIDNARVAIAGGSTGGHLAASTATLDKLPEETESSVSCTPNALILYNPVSDTTRRGYGGKHLGQRMTELSPVHHISKRMPPTLIFHGDADKTVPHENARRFKRLMDEAGNACELVTYAGAGHGFFNKGRENDQYEDTTRRLDRFLTKLGFLGPASSETSVAGRTLLDWKSDLAAKDKTKRRRAAHSIGQFGSFVSATFIEMLEHEDTAIQYIAASHIGDHQTPATAKDKLRSLLNGDSRGVRTAAAYALCRLGDLKAGLPVLEESMLVKERGIACSTAEFLGRVGPDAMPLTTLMQQELDKKNGDYHVRGALQNALREIRRDYTLVAHKRPTGGGNPRGWQPPKQATPENESQDQRPNILWISCEDISPNLACYGDTYARTPNLDRLARDGARFDRAFTPAGVCAVVRSGLITGVYSISQGSHHMRSNIVPPVGVKCFTEYLREAGYFCTNKSKTDYQFPSPKTAWDRQGNNHADWRDRAPGQPFFSVINLTVSHESQIRHGERTHAAILDRLSVDQRHDPDEAAKHLPPIYANTPESRKDWAWYADNISEMDRQAGLVLQQLEEDSLADNTLVVFWGDHGRGLPRGKRWIYESGVLVPLIVRWPGHVQADSVREDLVSTQDLAPTMLSVAGVGARSYMQGRTFLGASSQPEPEYLFFHRDRMDEAYELMRAARDRRFKYIRNYKVDRTYAQHINYMNKMPTLVDLRQMHEDGKLTHAQSRFFRMGKSAEELYDLDKDPHETVNLAWMSEYADRVSKMRAALEQWQEEITDVGMVPEPVLMEQMRPADKTQRVRAPEITYKRVGDKLEMAIACTTPGASIQYRNTLGDAKDWSWKLYSQPINVGFGDKIEATACRAGFRDSMTNMRGAPND